MHSKVSLLLGVFVWSLCTHVSRAADKSHLVTNLKGQPAVNFKQYAGYITVNESHGRALFYWFFEADDRAANHLPLAVWFNGGPGCSSVGNGALSELGPFFTNDAGTALVINNHSWTKAANILFLESPYGVGFSYSNTSSDYQNYTDEGIAKDAYAFLLGWFKKFPEYKANDFFMVGESYAGHYIPTLARLIVQGNKESHECNINFKGFAIGNPWTDAYYDNLGTTHFYHSHSIISDETYEAILANCDFANDLPVDVSITNQTCNRAVDLANTDMAKIDAYNVYGLSCNSNSSSKKSYFSAAAYDPCLDSVSPYLNTPAVQVALHARSAHWSACTKMVYQNYKRGDIVRSMLPVYQELLKEGLRIWIYSGDVDGVVATTGTRLWIKQLGLSIEIPWYAWNFGGQVGGWTQRYSGLTFATVRGAGHLVPFTQPERALALFKIFLSGKSLPSFHDFSVSIQTLI